MAFQMEGNFSPSFSGGGGPSNFGPNGQFLGMGGQSMRPANSQMGNARGGYNNNHPMSATGAAGGIQQARGGSGGSLLMGGRSGGQMGQHVMMSNVNVGGPGGALRSGGGGVLPMGASGHTSRGGVPPNLPQRVNNVGQMGSGGYSPSGEVLSMMGEDANDAVFSMADFPTLDGRVPGGGGSESGLGNGAGNPIGSSGSRGEGDMGGMMRGSGGVGNEVFQIQSEDFPALPGQQFGGKNALTDEDSVFQPQGLGQLGAFNSGKVQRGSSSAVGSGVYGYGGQANAGGSGEHRVSNEKAMGSAGGAYGDYPDRFGLLGLLGVIRMTDAHLNLLALGTDLTLLGLDLNSQDVLYSTFASPWADGPTRREPEYVLPLCYYMYPPMHPPSMKVSLFSDETLFYIFYSMPKDTLQRAAAVELYNRKWRFHKDLKLWFQHVPGTEVSKTQTYERGTYIYFDISKFERVRKDNFMLQYDHLEML